MLRANGIPMDNIAPFDLPAVQRRKLELLREQDTAYAHPQVTTRSTLPSRTTRLACRMQTSIPELTDVSREKEIDTPYVRSGPR